MNGAKNVILTCFLSIWLAGCNPQTYSLESIDDIKIDEAIRSQYVTMTGIKGIYVLAGKYTGFGIKNAQPGTLCGFNGDSHFQISQFLIKFPEMATPAVKEAAATQDRLIRKFDIKTGARKI